MVNIITTRNFRSLHPLKQRLGMMESHVKNIADCHYTVSVYSTRGKLRTLGYWEAEAYS